MAAITREYRLVDPALPELRRLQGSACIACGCSRGRLTPAGVVRTISESGETIPWNVRVCSDHKGMSR
jgi:hypothetical protein